MKSSAVCSCLGDGYLKMSNYRGADVGDGVWLVVEGVQRRFQQLSLSLDLAEVGHGSLISWTPPNC